MVAEPCGAEARSRSMETPRREGGVTDQRRQLRRQVEEHKKKDLQVVQVYLRLVKFSCEPRTCLPRSVNGTKDLSSKDSQLIEDLYSKDIREFQDLGVKGVKDVRGCNGTKDHTSAKMVVCAGKPVSHRLGDARMDVGGCFGDSPTDVSLAEKSRLRYRVSFYRSQRLVGFRAMLKPSFIAAEERQLDLLLAKKAQAVEASKSLAGQSSSMTDGAKRRCTADEDSLHSWDEGEFYLRTANFRGVEGS
eukprot:s840_g30.t1